MRELTFNEIEVVSGGTWPAVFGGIVWNWLFSPLPMSDAGPGSDVVAPPPPVNNNFPAGPGWDPSLPGADGFPTVGPVPNGPTGINTGWK